MISLVHVYCRPQRTHLYRFIQLAIYKQDLIDVAETILSLILILSSYPLVV